LLAFAPGHRIGRALNRFVNILVKLLFSIRDPALIILAHPGIVFDAARALQVFDSSLFRRDRLAVNGRIVANVRANEYLRRANDPFGHSAAFAELRRIEFVIPEVEIEVVPIVTAVEVCRN